LSDIFGEDALWIIGISDFLIFLVAIAMTAKHACIQLPKLFLKNKKLSPSGCYAFKNIQRTGTLSNLSSLIALLTITLACIFLFFGCFFTSFQNFKTLINGEYVVMYATDTSIERLKENDKVASVEKMMKITTSASQLYEEKSFIFSATNPEIFQNLFVLDELPKENEAYMFGLFAKALGLSLGDEFTLEIGGKQLDLVYTKAIPSNGEIIVINADYFQLPYNYTIINGAENVTKDELYREIQTTLAFDSAMVLDVNQIFETVLESNNFGYYCCLFMIFVISIYSVVGIVNNIISSYRSRKEQFECYAVAGMSNKQLRKMKTIELVASLSFGVIIGIIAIPIAYTIAFECTIAQRMNLIWVFFGYLL